MRRLLILSVVFFLGCSDMGEQTLQVQARGLWLTANPLDAPPGSLATADNAVIRRPGIVEPRRGQKPDTEVAQAIDAMAAFEGKVIAHGASGAIYTRTGVGTYSTRTGTFTAPTGHPVRFAEAGGGLYFTTNAGPYRMDSPTTDPVAAGIPPGLEGSGTTTGASGWLATGRVVGYRFVWGARDGDGALMLGAPSGRVLVTNSSGGSRDISLTTPIPDGIVAGTHFLQVYRTVIDAASGDDPGEDMAQVAEYFPTAAQLSASSMTVTDTASFANGATAYFSPSSGAGIADSKQQPPLVTDAISFKGYLFGVVQAYSQFIELTLLGTGGGTGIQDTDGLVFYEDGTEVFRITGNATEDASIGQFLVETISSAAVDIETTARSIVRVLNTYASSTVYAQYVSGVNDLPGKIVIAARTLNAGIMSVRAFNKTSPWIPRLGQEITANSIVRVGSTVTVGVGSSVVQSLAVGDTISMISVDPLPEDTNFPFGTFTITAVDPVGSFSYTQAGSAVTGTKNYYFFETPDVGVFTQEAVPGSWAHSAFQEPDAWPPRFRYQVGGPNTTLQRITAQGEALLFWTSDGLYRLTGNDEDDFTLRPVDPTVNLVGTSTPATMGNKAFALTTQGVVSVTDLGVEKVSTAIDQALLPYYAGTTTFRDVTDTAAFGVAYQSENEYYLFLPTDNGPAPGDPAVQAYVFNTQTGTWVRHTWEWAGINAGTQAISAGVVDPSDNFFYLGADDWITRERKNRGLPDYQDADNVGIPLDVAYNVETAKNPGALKQWTEVACLLESPQPTSVALYFTTEIDSTEAGGTITSKGNKAVRTYVPRNMSRSARLTVGLRHSTSQQKPTILGLSVVYNTSSTRVGR